MNNQPPDVFIETVEPLTPRNVPPPLPREVIEGVIGTTRFGELLQRSRDAARMTRADIANSLRLSVRVIIALEENDLAALPVPAFVRGYLRGYAKLVNIQPELVLAAYERGLTAQTPIPPPKASSLPQWNSEWLRQPLPIAVAGLVVLMGWWWHDRDAPITPTVPTPMASSPVLPAAPSSTTPAAATPSSATPVVAPSAANGATAQGADSQPQESAEALATDPPSEDGSTTTTAPAPTTDPHRVATAASSTVGSTSSATGATAANTTTPPPPSVTPNTAPAAQPTVTIQTSKDTWVRVKDGAGQVLFDAPLDANQSRSFQGKTPFQVKLKKAAGVTVTYDGKPFDFSEYTKGRGARFTLGEADHAH